MRSKLYPVLLAATLAVVSVLCWNVYAQKKESTKLLWEYNVVSFSGDNPFQLSQLGSEGWELTSVRSEEQMLGNFRQTKVYYYLKRPRQVGK
jgi:hypothetical protein